MINFTRIIVVRDEVEEAQSQYNQSMTKKSPFEYNSNLLTILYEKVSFFLSMEKERESPARKSFKDQSFFLLLKLFLLLCFAFAHFLLILDDLSPTSFLPFCSE